MGNRLSQIVTRTGDAGTTGLATGDRVRKTAPRVDAMGDVDELNCVVGLLLAQTADPNVHAAVEPVQHELFDLGGELAMPAAEMIGTAHVDGLEQSIVAINENLPPLKEFVLPGGSPVAATAHLCRAVCRRAERTLWRLSEQEAVRPELTRYLNRLSDLLFVVARHLARADGAEVTWRKNARDTSQS